MRPWLQCYRHVHGIGLHKGSFFPVYLGCPAFGIWDSKTQNLWAFYGNAARNHIRSNLQVLQGIFLQLSSLLAIPSHRLADNTHGTKNVAPRLIKRQLYTRDGLLGISKVDRKIMAAAVMGGFLRIVG